MAHLWIQDGEQHWHPHPLAGGPVAITPAGELRELCAVPGVDAAADGTLLWLDAGTIRERAALLPGSALVRVNGARLTTGLRALRDRDAIGLGETTLLFFSTERLAAVAPFPGAAHRVICPRCKQPIAEQTLAVQCPACGGWHHQSDDLPCWLHLEVCAACPQPTTLEAGYRWTPELL